MSLIKIIQNPAFLHISVLLFTEKQALAQILRKHRWYLGDNVFVIYHVIFGRPRVVEEVCYK